MKRVLGVLFMACFLFTALSAQEEEKKPSRFRPSGGLSNMLLMYTDHNSEAEEAYNVDKSGLYNLTTANFGVGIKILDNFSLRPSVSDTVMFNFGEPAFMRNDFQLGLTASYRPLSMLSLSITPRYHGRYTGKSTKLNGKATKLNFEGHGFRLISRVAASLEDYFLDISFTHTLKTLTFARTLGEEKGNSASHTTINNDLNLSVSLEFFKFINENLEGGLDFSNETRITNVGVKHKKDGKMGASFDVENDIALGLHYSPLSFVSTSFGTTFTPSYSKAWDPETKKYDEAEKSFSIALNFGLDLSKDRYSLGFYYNPTVYEKATGEDPNRNLEHELILTAGVSF